MSDQNNNIKTTVILDTTQAQRQIIELNAKASDTTKTLKERVAAKNKQIKIQNQLSKKTVKDLRKEVNGLKKVGASEKKVTAATKKLNTARVRATRASANNIKQLNRLSIVSKKSSGIIGGLSARFLGWTAVIFGAFRALKSMFGLITEFEKKNKELSAILQLPIDQMGALSDNAEHLGAITAKTALEVTKLQIAYARLGFTQDEILNLTEATISGSIAMNSSLDRTANLVGALVRSFNTLDSIDAPHVIDVLALSTAKSALNFEKLEAGLPIVAGAANALNIPLETVVATLGKLADSGIIASTAATALRNIYIESAKRGINYKDALKQIANSTDKLTVANKLFGKRAAVSALIIANNAKGVAEFSDQLKKAKDVAQEMADKQLVSISGKATLLSSAWSGLVLAIDNGNGAFSTAIKGLLDMTTGFLKAINPTEKLSEKMNDQRLELFELESKIKDVNTSQKDRLELLDKFKTDYPGYLDNLETDKITNEDLSKAISSVNDELFKKITLQREDEKIADQAEKTADVQEEVLKRRKKLREELASLIDKYGFKLKDNATLEEQAIDILNQGNPQVKLKGELFNILGIKLRFLSTDIVHLNKWQKSLDAQIARGNKLNDEKIAKAEDLGIVIETEIEKTKRLAKEQKEKDAATKKGLIDTILLLDKTQDIDELRKKTLEQLNDILILINKKQEDAAKLAEANRKKRETQRRHDNATALKLEQSLQDDLTLIAIKSEEERQIEAVKLRTKHKKDEIDNLLISEEEKVALKKALDEKANSEIDDIKLEHQRSFEDKKRALQNEIDLENTTSQEERDTLKATQDLEKDLIELERLEISETQKWELKKKIIEEYNGKIDGIVTDSANRKLKIQEKAAILELKQEKSINKAKIQVAQSIASELTSILGDSLLARLASIALDAIIGIAKINIETKFAQRVNLAHAVATPPPGQGLAISRAKALNTNLAVGAKIAKNQIIALSVVKGAGAILSKINSHRGGGSISSGASSGGGSSSTPLQSVGTQSIDNISANNAARLGIDPAISGNATTSAANRVNGSTPNTIVFSESRYQDFQNQINFKEEKTTIG